MDETNVGPTGTAVKETLSFAGKFSPGKNVFSALGGDGVPPWESTK